MLQKVVGEGFLAGHVYGAFSEQKSAPGFNKKSSGTPAKSGSGKKSSRKDDEWEEVSRKFVVSLLYAVYFCILFLCLDFSAFHIVYGS